MRTRLWLLSILAAALVVSAPAPLPAADKKGGGVSVDIYIDRKENKDFVEENEAVGTKVYHYDAQGFFADTLAIRPVPKVVMQVWKDNATLVADTSGRKWTSGLFIDADFAPVLLVVDVKNNEARSVQLKGAYLEMKESYTDLQPFLSIVTDYDPWCGEDGAKFDPKFGFENNGWGGVQDAQITFSFGSPDSKGKQRFTTQVGTFRDTQQVSVHDALEALNVNVAELESGRFPCSDGNTTACLQRLVQSGLFGNAANAVFTENTGVLTRVSGMLNYRWTDSKGAQHERKSPISVDVPLLQFEPRGGAECGGPGAVERDFKTVKLSLDRENYRIPLSYKGKLAPKQNRRFALALVADKSSQHTFRVVLQLSNGKTVASPKVDLLYFKPRFEVTH